VELYTHEDYQEYYDAQVEKNIRKINLVFVKQPHIDWMAQYVENNVPDCKFGICHGVRNGWEVQAFRKALGTEVIGTDISHTATQFEDTIEWDFHEVKEEWLDNVDFIYSNSFDHSFDPEMCLDKWMSCINKNGVCFIHWNFENSRPGIVDAADCYGATKSDYIQLFSNKYKIVLDYYSDTEHINLLTKNTIFAIKHRE
jgi:hypothetical protein